MLKGKVGDIWAYDGSKLDHYLILSIRKVGKEKVYDLLCVGHKAHNGSQYILGYSYPIPGPLWRKIA